jgi:aspartate/methionine/tyrosine aminotransferase
MHDDNAVSICYQGLPELRQGIADFIDNYSAVVNPTTEILPLMGSKRVLCIFYLVSLNEGMKYTLIQDIQHIHQ